MEEGAVVVLLNQSLWLVNPYSKRGRTSPRPAGGCGPATRRGDRLWCLGTSWAPQGAGRKPLAFFSPSCLFHPHCRQFLPGPE